jgi:copper transport protein
MMASLILPGHAFAHAALIKAEPEMDARLPESPPQVSLTFNERLEEGLYYIKVYDSGKKQVTAANAVMNSTRTGLYLDLPKLADGDYIVTYHVISADGHPVEGTYLFSIGQGGGANASLAEAMQGMHRHDGLSLQIGWSDIVQFLSRILYYFSLLAVTGWVVWMRLYKPKDPETGAYLLKWFVWLQRAFLLSVIFMIFTHMQDAVGSGGAQALVELFTKTGLGISWLIVLILALLGFVLIRRSLAIDVLWAAVVWLAKSFSGHAAAFEPVRETITVDFIHLAAASVWVGGLVMLVVLLRYRKEEALAFLPLLSNAALLSIAFLIISGIVSVLLFLPDVSYVFYTQWGWLLLGKSALVLLVVITAAFIRRTFRKRQDTRLRRWLALDVSLMFVIVAIVGVFTYLSPLPPNEPLHWHVMGERQHMTVQITPNEPGNNTFIVKVWLPEKMGKPKQVQLKLFNEDGTDIAPITVPITAYEDQQQGETYGMVRHSYRAEGHYLPFAGRWKVEVRVLDSADDETVYDKTIRLY